MALKACKKNLGSKNGTTKSQKNNCTKEQLSVYVFRAIFEIRTHDINIPQAKPISRLWYPHRHIKCSGMRARRPFSPTSMRLKWSPAFYLVRKGLPEN